MRTGRFALALVACGEGGGASGGEGASCLWPEEPEGKGCPGGPGPSRAPETAEELCEGFAVHRNLTFAERGGLALQGDLFTPPVRGTPPGVLVVVHGGRWQECTRRRAAVEPVAQVLARALGVGVFNVEYRLRQEGVAIANRTRDLAAP